MSFELNWKVRNWPDHLALFLAKKIPRISQGKAGGAWKILLKNLNQFSHNLPHRITIVQPMSESEILEKRKWARFYKKAGGAYSGHQSNPIWWSKNHRNGIVFSI
jgi:hypothetical protein